MINPSEWFSNQLSANAEGLFWAANQVPGERQYKKPPQGLGEWSAARHIFHMLYYEQTIALPSMRQWYGEPSPLVQDSDEETAWNGSERMDDLLLKFQNIRDQQIALLPKLGQTDWDRVCDTIWGPVTLLWVVTKTYQHTMEHISDLLRIALFWERAATREN